MRQPALFGAAWTLGSIAALAGSGVHGLTYYDTQGPAGVIERPGRQPEPGRVLLPAGHAVPARGGARRRGEPGRRPDPRAGRARSGPDRGDCRRRGRRSARTTLLLANLTAQTSDVRVGLAGHLGARARILDEHTAGAAAADLPGFLESRSDLPVSEGAVTVTLAPYATARLDLTGA